MIDGEGWGDGVPMSKPPDEICGTETVAPDAVGPLPPTAPPYTSPFTPKSSADEKKGVSIHFLECTFFLGVRSV